MVKRLMLVCCVLLAALLWSAVVAHGANVIDFAYTLYTGSTAGWVLLDDEGTLWRAGDSYLPGGVCMTTFPSHMGLSYPGACAIDYGFCGDTHFQCGVIAFFNGDLQPVDDWGYPVGDLIPGPPGASNVEDVIIGFTLDEFTIRSGCVFWDWDGTTWTGPCEPLPGGASQTAPESWGKIKAEFKD